MFKRIVDYVLKKHGFKVPIIDKDDALILFLKDDKNYMNRIEKILIEIQEYLPTIFGKKGILIIVLLMSTKMINPKFTQPYIDETSYPCLLYTYRV